ncbi:hypothetical protein HNP38_003186 [Chryseobacterium defluvii]|uniref:Uncharacterized protein n=1 Tax=Chryseobacterium defluvii TaxID=160396 RepID=A0A840KK38_9FLAO|nr:hypothetical protein [Chryseobacterium defluvii]MBB4807870.1 hypothetical protein [Chryseobacterium defluvii]
MKKEIRQIMMIGAIVWGSAAHSQIRIANSTTNLAVTGSSAFIDASSNATYNSSSNTGKGLLYPRVDLTTFTSFGGAPIGLPTSFPSYYDGFVVYNTNTGGVAGVGTTEGTLTSGFWYYDNKSRDINGGTWKPFIPSSGTISITNVLTSTGNTATSTVNGISSSAPIVNSNALSLSGNNLTSTVNGVASTVNLASLITSGTTNTLISGGVGNNTLTSTVNGVAASTTAVKTVGNTVSGNTLSTTVNGVSGTTVPIINSNTLSLSGSSLTSSVNGVASGAINLSPAITAATTNVLSSSGNTMTSTVNGISRTAPIINSVSNTVSGNTLITRVNGVPSSSVTLPQSVNIYNSDGTLTEDRIVSTDNRMLWFQTNANNHIAFDVNATLSGYTRLITRGSSSSLVRALVNSNRTLDMELLAGGASRLLSTGSSELFIGTNTSSGPLIFGVGTNRATLDTNGNFGIGTVSPEAKLDVRGGGIVSGRLGVGVTDPLSKLDVDGNARFRSVPSGNLGDTDRYLGITSSGTLKKFDMDLPSFALYATSTQSVLRNADDVSRPLAIQNTRKINTDYIERVDSNTFRVKKGGIYTIEVWGKFSNIPSINNADDGANARLGVTLKLSVGGDAVQLIGSRWKEGEGTTNVTRTVILNANEQISIESVLSRSNGQYRETPGSSIFITYLPL